MATALRSQSMPALLRVDVHEPGVRPRSGRLSCKIGQHLKFSTEGLASYFFAKWEPVIFDALLVAAAVEFCDRSQRRATHCWARRFELRIPVHNPRHWNGGRVRDALRDALSFLTGDAWHLEFVPRSKAEPSPMQSSLFLPSDAAAVIPFSEGMDSRAVAGLLSLSLGDTLIRVRLGSKAADASSLARHRYPFASVPYQVHEAQRFVETSARSRGFKFATISGVAAYLAKASQIIVPESGQGALGPALVSVGQAYADYRNHPRFTDLMEKYFAAVFGYGVRFEFPRLWHTKAETLKEFVEKCADAYSWESTWSCWQSARQVSVDGRKRQCGVCAACMLRRQSVHAAGLAEQKETYVWENLDAPSFEKGAAKTFDGVTEALREYAIAGTLHLDHLAALQSSEAGRSALDLCAFQLGKSRGLPEAEARVKLARLISQHEKEWRNFMNALGKDSFAADWAAHVR